MCGIVGFVGPGDQRIIKNMADAITHRGPDDEGFYIDPQQQVYFGHRRLSIIDLHNGHQPMLSADHNITVIFNGEIYNHLALRKQLSALGHQFRTDHSDTEVLIHGYKQWGESLPVYLQGMFAFAIYDKVQKKIFLARDRFGQKPLYYAKQGDLFIFASELKAIFKHPLYQQQLNKLSLKKFFAYGFLPAPNCQYQDTYKLPGGHLLTYNVTKKTISTKIYWQFKIEPDNNYNKRSEEDLCEELRFLLSQSVKRRLMSDVPLGIFLSGGIDSSSILALACNNNTKSLQTFAIGFQEKSFDESAYAKNMADYYQVQHHCKILSIAQAKALIPNILKHLNEPLADASILPTYLISEFASQKVKVILGGDGGDELFAGYDPFKALRYATWYQRLIPNSIHHSIRKLADLLPMSSRNMSLEFKIKRTLKGLSYDQKLWNPVWMSPLEAKDISDLFEEKITAEELYSESIIFWNQSNSSNIVDKTLEYFTKFYLQDDILTKVDRASMKTSLECRSPFLDYDLVEFTRKLPHHYKLRNGTTKYILKKAMQPLLPREILQRRKKGFGVPISAWLRELPKTLPTTPLVDSNQNYVKNLWQQHRQQKADHRLFLWAWLVAQYQLPNNREVANVN